MRLFYRLIIGFLVVASMSWITGYFAVSHSKEALRKAFMERTEFLARELLDGMEKEIESKVEIFRDYTHDLDLQEEIARSNQAFERFDNIQAYIARRDKEWLSAPEGEITPFMQGLLNNRLSEELKEKEGYYKDHYGYRVFGEVFVTNKYGANVAQTGRTTDYRQDDEEWWQSAKKEGVYIRDVNFDESADVYSIDFAVRVDDREGNFIGVIKAVLNIDDIINIILGVEDTWSQKGHKTLEFKIIDSLGRLIYSTKDFKFLEDVSYLISTSHLHPGFKDTRVFSEVKRKKDERRDIFVTHVHSAGATGPKWILLVEQDTEELFAPVARLKKRILAVSMIITVFGILTGFLFSRAVSGTINKLIEATARIGSGDLDARTGIKSEDEFGQLAAAFEYMADELKANTVKRDTLREEVEEHKKTEEKLIESDKELKKRVDELEKFYNMAIGRELKMKELKNKIEELRVLLLQYRDKV